MGSRRNNSDIESTLKNGFTEQQLLYFNNPDKMNQLTIRFVSGWSEERSAKALNMDIKFVRQFYKNMLEIRRMYDFSMMKNKRYLN